MKKNIIFSIYPCAKGFGYAVMQEPNNLIDFGVANVNPISNDKIIKRIAKMIEFYHPTVLLIPRGYNGKRVMALLSLIITLSSYYRIPLFQYTRQQIQHVFEQFHAKSKYDIAVQLVSVFPQLHSWLPRKRGTADPESYTAVIFDAMSLVTVYKYLTE